MSTTKKSLAQIAGESFEKGLSFKTANVEVIVGEADVMMRLYGNLIARKDKKSKAVSLFNKNTKTTRSYLNAIKGVFVYVKKGKTYLNGKVWENPNILTEV